MTGEEFLYRAFIAGLALGIGVWFLLVAVAAFRERL